MLNDLRHFRAELRGISPEQANALIAVFVIAYGFTEALGRLAG